MSSASSGGKSLAVLIKKAMAKMPMSYDTKKSIDEYYKTTIKEIVMKMKAEEKATKAKADAMKAKGVKGKTVKKQKKVGGGFELPTTKEFEDILYRFKLFHYNCTNINNNNINNMNRYLYSDRYKEDLNNLISKINKYGDIIHIDSNSTFDIDIDVIDTYITDNILQYNNQKYVDYYEDKSYPYSFDDFTKGVAGVRRTFVPKF
jgi:hypothetical protein